MLGVGAFAVVSPCPSTVGYCCDELALPTAAGLQGPPYVSCTSLWKPKGVFTFEELEEFFEHNDEGLDVDGDTCSILLLDDLPEQRPPAIDDDHALYNEWAPGHLPPHVDGSTLPASAVPSSSCCCCNQLAEPNMEANGMVPSCNEPSTDRVVATQAEAAALVVGGLAYTSSSLLPLNPTPLPWCLFRNTTC
ncbi:hypothetical protein QOT17_015217 [Balamuthia mandrillaris]